MNEPQAGEVVTSGVEPFPAGPHGSEEHASAAQEQKSVPVAETEETVDAALAAAQATEAAALTAEAVAAEAKATWLKEHAQTTGAMQQGATTGPLPTPQPVDHTPVSAKSPSQSITPPRGRPVGFAQGPAPAQKA
jgi:hypothetical protein